MSRDLTTETGDKKSHLLVVDDHPIMRFGITQLIQVETDLEISAEAGTAAEALQLLENTPIDLAIIDLSLPDRNGLELIKDIRAMYPEVRCLVVSMHDENLYAERVLRNGGRGYLRKVEAAKKLVSAIRQVLAGGIFVSEALSARIMEHIAGGSESTSPIDCLSDRELEVFRLLGEGNGSRDVAGKLNISVRTVDAHRAHIKEKLGLKDATELVHHAVRWVESNDQP